MGRHAPAAPRRPSPLVPPPASVALLLSSALLAVGALGSASGTDDGDASASRETSRQNPVAVSYYNLIITEYSYKFWAAFMVATLIMLVYSCLAAIWVAHTVYLPPPISYDEYDYLAKRSLPDEDVIDPSPGWWPQNPPSPRTTRRVFRAIAEPPLPT